MRAGEPQAIQAVRDAGRYLGEVLAGCVNFFNPGAIVIGGDISDAHQQLLAGVREVIFQRSLPLATGDLRIVPSRLGDRAGAIGAGDHGDRAHPRARGRGSRDPGRPGRLSRFPSREAHAVACAARPATSAPRALRDAAEIEQQVAHVGRGDRGRARPSARCTGTPGRPRRRAGSRPCVPLTCLDASRPTTDST